MVVTKEEFDEISKCILPSQAIGMPEHVDRIDRMCIDTVRENCCDCCNQYIGDFYYTDTLWWAVPAIILGLLVVQGPLQILKRRDHPQYNSYLEHAPFWFTLLCCVLAIIHYVFKAPR